MCMRNMYFIDIDFLNCPNELSFIIENFLPVKGTTMIIVRGSPLKHIYFSTNLIDGANTL